MQDPNFERQVQQKMEELSFSPPDAVWVKVDAEINKDRKRRKPFLWLFLFLGLSLAGGAYLIFPYTKKPVLSESKSPAIRIAPEVKEGTKKQSATKTPTEIAPGPAGKNELPATSLSTVNPGQKNKKDKQPFRDYNAVAVQKQKLQVDGYANKYRKDDEASKQKNEQHAIPEKNAETNESNRNNPDSTAQGTVDASSDKKKNNPDAAISKKDIADSSVKNKNVAVAIAQIPPQNATKAKAKKQHSSSWQVGITAGGGISTINKSLFKSTYLDNSNNNGSYLANNPTGGGPLSPPAAYLPPSEIKPHFSFSAGFFVKKLLAKRVSFSAGLNYHYYSTEIQTGHPANGAVNIYYTGFAAALATNYYQNGNGYSYVNAYHFLEAPVLMDFQLNKNNKLPISWQAGASATYLIGSNALHFDPVSGVYYKNNNLFNKTQFNAVTALLVGFHIHGNLLQAGPQLQYGLSGLLNKKTGDEAHLLFTGLKLSFIPGKK